MGKVSISLSVSKMLVSASAGLYLFVFLVLGIVALGVPATNEPKLAPKTDDLAIKLPARQTTMKLVEEFVKKVLRETGHREANPGCPKQSSCQVQIRDA